MMVMAKMTTTTQKWLYCASCGVAYFDATYLVSLGYGYKKLEKDTLFIKL